jgi:sorbitol/mannitol transport system substrate-binding protein
MALLTAMANSFGARWFDEVEASSTVWTLTFYVDLMKAAGPPGASTNGFNENLALFNAGKCGMWIDATVAASMVSNPKESRVADKVGFALAPTAGLGKGANWLWAWTLAVPAGSKKADAAEKFIAWATGRTISRWSPPGGLGQRAARHAQVALQQPGIPQGGAVRQGDARLDQHRRPDQRHGQPKPYIGVQFAAIPSFRASHGRRPAVRRGVDRRVDRRRRLHRRRR